MSKNESEKKTEIKSAPTKVAKTLSPAPKPTSVTEKKPAPASEPKKTTPVQVQAEKTAPVRASSNHIYIGKKPVMSYAMSSLIQLTASGEIVLKARGLAISRAVDVAEIVTKRLGNNAYAIKKVDIDTEKLGEGEDIRSVSSIELIVGKK
jgi:DNA-binding protein|tara:strand:- start:48 stop:497 length:450 start_codon:yes stop_codon:yes gene_type:complete